MNAIEAIIRGTSSTASDTVKGAARMAAGAVPNPASTIYNLGLGIGPLIRNIVDEMKKKDAKKQPTERPATSQEQQTFTNQIVKQNQILFKQLAASTALLKEIRDVQVKQLSLLNKTGGGQPLTRIAPKEQKATVLQRLFQKSQPEGDEETKTTKSSMGDMEFGALGKVLSVAGIAVLIGTLFKSYQNLPEAERKKLEQTLGEAKEKIVKGLQDTVISSLKGLVELAWDTSKLGTVLGGLVIAKMTGVLDAMVLAAKAGGLLWRGASVYGKIITGGAMGSGAAAAGKMAGGGSGGAISGANTLGAAGGAGTALSSLSSTLGAIGNAAYATQQAVQPRPYGGGGRYGYGLDRYAPGVQKASERMREMRERAEANRLAREGTGPKYGRGPAWQAGAWGIEAERYNRIQNMSDAGARFRAFRQFESEMGPNMVNVKRKWSEMYVNPPQRPTQPIPPLPASQPTTSTPLGGIAGASTAAAQTSALTKIASGLGRVFGVLGVAGSGYSAYQNFKQGNSILGALDTISAVTGAGALTAGLTGIGAPVAIGLGAISALTALGSMAGSYFVDKKPQETATGRPSITATEAGTVQQTGVKTVDFNSTKFGDLDEDQKIAFLEGQARAEGFGRAGTIPTTHNNPGAIMMGSFAAEFGGVPGRQALNGPVIAHFPTLEQGRRAQRALWERPDYSSKPIAQGLQRWHAANPEAAANYANTIAQRMKEGGQIVMADAQPTPGMTPEATALQRVTSPQAMGGLMFAELQNQFNAAASIIAGQQIKLDFNDIMNKANNVGGPGAGVGGSAPPLPSPPPARTGPTSSNPITDRHAAVAPMVNQYTGPF